MSAPRRPFAFCVLSACLVVPSLRAQAPLQFAWIKDRNLDGIADQVHLKFSQVPAQLPFLVAAAWTEETLDYREASGSQLTYAPGDSTHVIVDFSDSVFVFGVTGISRAGSAWVRLPPQGGLPLQEQRLGDSVPPILVGATFHPGPASGDLDTLRVLVSEPLKAGDFKNLLLYSATCADPGRGALVDMVQNPAADWNGTGYLVVTLRRTGSPRVGGCVGLNGFPVLSDLSGTPANERKLPIRPPDPVSIRRLPAWAPDPIQGVRARADGRRVPAPRAGSAPRAFNLITFKAETPQEGPSHDHTLGHSEP